jgi:hypothetical protein
VPQGAGNAFVSGSVYAFDRQTGKPLWPYPATLEQWGLPLTQPMDLPVLVFARRVTEKTKGNRTRLSFLFMDKRTGQLVVDPEPLDIREYHFQLEGDEENKRVTVLFRKRDTNLSLQFTDTPKSSTGTAVSSEGPVQLPGEQPVKKGGIKAVIGAVLEAVGKAALAAQAATGEGAVPADAPRENVKPPEQVE